jgi:hypothetical protein
MDKSCENCKSGSILNPGECRRYPWHDAQVCRDGGFSQWVERKCDGCEGKNIEAKAIKCMQCEIWIKDGEADAGR